MMVGVDALITSWCKILKPASHLAASSLESAGETNRNRNAVSGSGKTTAQTLAPASHTVQTGGREGGSPCQRAVLQEGTKTASPSDLPSWF